MACSEKRARLLLERGGARAHRALPFIIRLVDRQAQTCTHQPLRLKLDTNSKVTWLATPKIHALDALCLGELNAILDWHKPTLSVKCMGWGNYQHTRLDRCGFPGDYLMRSKRVQGIWSRGLGSLYKCLPERKRTAIHAGWRDVPVAASTFKAVAASCEASRAGIANSFNVAIGYGYTQIASTKGIARWGAASLLALSLPAVNDRDSRIVG